MKLAIMQPYLFPYIGYFQLLNSVDIFVLYDDVQYIKGGWINRNRILDNNKPSWITFPVKMDSTYSNINQRCFAERTEAEINKLLRRIDSTYSKAQYFEDTSDIIKRFVLHDNKNVAESISFSLQIIQQYLQLPFNYILSSSLKDTQHLRGEERVIRICEALKADVYINSPGGQSLYSREQFQAHGISLRFLKPGPVSYRQFTDEFVPNLSIIDVLMFNSAEEVKAMLNKWELV